MRCRCPHCHNPIEIVGDDPLTVPVVHHVGGLTKVNNNVNGYAYYYHTGEALTESLRTAVDTLARRPDVHLRLIRQGIQLIHDWYTWEKVIERGYLPLYERAMRHAEGGQAGKESET